MGDWLKVKNVIHNQDVGIIILNVDPFIEDATSTDHPNSTAACLTMDNPSPVPPVSRERLLSMR